MKRFLSFLLNSTLALMLVVPLGSNPQAQPADSEASITTRSTRSSTDSASAIGPEHPGPAPPAPPEPIDPNGEAPRQEPPEDGYFYYFDSRPVPLKPVGDQVVVGLADAAQDTKELTIDGIDLSGATRLSHEGAEVPQVRMDVSEPEPDLSSTLERLRSHPAVRFASPVFKGSDEDVRFFFGDTITAQFKKGISQEAIDAALRSLNLTREKQARWDDATWILDVSDSAFNALEAANKLLESDLVEYSEPNLTFLVSRDRADAGEPLDRDGSMNLAAQATADYYEGWHLDTIGARDARALVENWGSKIPIVAVVDTGVQRDHPDLDDNLHPLGYDYQAAPPGGVGRGDPDLTCQENSHGTKVAGAVAAEPNGWGSEGVGGNEVQVMAVRVGTSPGCDPCQGQFSTEDVVDGVTWAAENGADVVNLSLGHPFSSTSGVLLGQYGAAIEYARQLNAVVVAGSGNENTASVYVPARLPGAVAVGGTLSSDARWWEDICPESCQARLTCGSNYGRTLDIVGPAVLIHTTTIISDYAYASGTSLAAPQVAATAALMRAVNPTLSPTQIRHILQRTAVKAGPYDYDQRLGEGGWNEEMGFGRLDAYEAVRAALQPVILSFTARLDWVDGENHSNEVAIAVVGPNATGVGKSRTLFSEGITTTDNSGNGALELDGIPPGTYTVCAKPRRYLGRCVTRHLEPGLNLSIDFSEGGSYLFRPGDFNIGGEDGEVNGMDWEPFISLWRACIDTGAQDVCGEVDLDRNGTVNTRDIVIRHNTAGYAPHSDGHYPNDPEEIDVWRPFRSEGVSSSAVQGVLEPASSPDVLLLGDADEYDVGDVFDVNIWMDLRFAWPGADSANAIIHYDPGVLEVIDADADMEGIQVTPGPLFPYYDRNIVDESKGQVYFGGYVGSTDSPVQTLDRLATITFRATAAISPTEISAYLVPGETLDTNAAERGTSKDVLSEAQQYAPVIAGSPARPMPSVTISPSGGDTMNSHFPLIHAQAEDSFEQVEWVQFWAWHDSDWHYIGTDTESADGWAIEWNTTGVTDQSVWLWAYAAVPGGEGGSTMTEAITLDRTPPEYDAHTFFPFSPSMADQIDLDIYTSDNLAGVRRVEACVNDATDGSADGRWRKIGEISGATGVVVWETSSFQLGMHQVAFAMEDAAGNWNRWREGPTIQYDLRYWADFNYDCFVDVLDLQAVASRWRCRVDDSCYAPGYDIDGDGVVSVVDIMQVVSEWGWTCP